MQQKNKIKQINFSHRDNIRLDIGHLSWHVSKCHLASPLYKSPSAKVAKEIKKSKKTQQHKIDLNWLQESIISYSPATFFLSFFLSSVFVTLNLDHGEY